MDASTDPAATASEWSRLLECCSREEAVGFGLLDSFLSGPDLDRRIDLVVAEAGANRWLRLELRDTVSLDQGHDWSNAQRARLVHAAATA